MDENLVQTAVSSTATSIGTSDVANPPAFQTGIKEPGDPKAVLALLDEWRADDSGYDEAVWPALKAALEANRAGERRRFNE